MWSAFPWHAGLLALLVVVCARLRPWRYLSQWVRGRG